MYPSPSRTVALIGALFGALQLSAQAYTSYFTGNTTDAVTTPLGGLCLMGGATESDPAMVWFLQRATGGDVLVLRASGSDGYNDYFYTDLGVTVNSVETIVFNNATASSDPYVHQRIQQAEAIWFAGGDQWNYVSYWQGTAVDSLIREAITQRNVVIGGTSAGMAILAGLRFTAQNGTVTSVAALNDPYASNVTLDGSTFMDAPGMEGVITDTHFDNPDRRGRLMTFIARSYVDNGSPAFGIACEEYVAVCIGDDGLAHVYGEYPDYDDFAWFVQANCGEAYPPEICTAGVPLTWDHFGMAVKACKVPGDVSGSNNFDLNDRRTTVGGSWEDWSVENGSLTTSVGSVPDCSIGLQELQATEWRCVPMQYGARLIGVEPNAEVRVMDLLGRSLPFTRARASGDDELHWTASAAVLVVVSEKERQRTFLVGP
ncbi:MAG: cyanophycinase [Flavobacteriales bacterium]|nr:cyanophycinase [Flavobacteriales bacterium]MCB0786161.1 cyanophycinase [Flavobacteriales bacterium]MCB0811003.1 cyanophycinase [Flavobacteriales bacterium]MCB0814890.1 cyanophycinase [Flavobacteriales bacterium]HRW91049.1 cyanophycinase [Flavobacteriales bacterium]